MCCPGEGSAFLSFKKGDLIRLDHEDGQDVMSSGWCCGICERTGEKGDFPAECVYVLPAITRPPPEVLVSHSCCHHCRPAPLVQPLSPPTHQVLFADQSPETERILETTQSALGRLEAAEKPHTLEQYSYDYFLPPPKRTLRHTLSSSTFRRKDSGQPWSFTRVSGGTGGVVTRSVPGGVALHLSK